MDIVQQPRASFTYMEPLVSILIPAYNAEKWISDALRSALSQTWRNKEIIIVDDGSADETLRICRKFESPAVKVVTQQNSGAAAARNRALGLAQGVYIQWLDADDLLAPDKISEQLKPADSRGSGTLLSSSFGTFFYAVRNAKFVSSALWQDLTPLEWILYKFNENIWMHPAAWLVSRDLTQKAGPWDERLSLDDDGEYFCRVAAASRTIRFFPNAKSYYRQLNLSSVSRDISDTACRSLLLSLGLCFGHLRTLEDSERTRRACLNHLQTWYSYFYPEKSELLPEVHALAGELGGTLRTPELSWKYYPVMKILGWKAAKKMMAVSRRSKATALQGWDRMLYALSGDERSRNGWSSL